MDVADHPKETATPWLLLYALVLGFLVFELGFFYFLTVYFR